MQGNPSYQFTFDSDQDLLENSDMLISMEFMVSQADPVQSGYIQQTLPFHAPCAEDTKSIISKGYFRHESPVSTFQLEGKSPLWQNSPPTPPHDNMTPYSHINNDPASRHLGVSYSFMAEPLMDTNLLSASPTCDSVLYDPLTRGYTLESIDSVLESMGQSAFHETLSSHPLVPTTTSDTDTVFPMFDHLPNTPPSDYESSNISCCLPTSNQGYNELPIKSEHKIASSLSPTSSKRKRSNDSPHPRSKKLKLSQMMTPPAQSPSPSATDVFPLETGDLKCPNCPGKTWKDSHDLQRHKRQQHTRPYVCVFGFAGCTSTFASKNEWKRHVQSQHILLHFWLCTEGACAKAETHEHCKAQGISRGVIFNRKDLYTQHVRRMHATSSISTTTSSSPASKKKGGDKKRSNKGKDKEKELDPVFEERLKYLQQEALKERCQLPRYMTCPVATCDQKFHGSNAWDDRMEHVAKHLERSALFRSECLLMNEAKDPDKVVFGGADDHTLLDWASSQEVAVIMATKDGEYKQWNPIKWETGPVGAGVGRKHHTIHHHRQHNQVDLSTLQPASDEEDAEGESDFSYS